MSARRAEDDLEARGELELPAPLRHGGRRLGERLAAPRAHLDLGRDQLTDEMGLERRADGSGRDLLEAVDETERLGVEDREPPPPRP